MFGHKLNTGVWRYPQVSDVKVWQWWRIPSLCLSFLLSFFHQFSFLKRTIYDMSQDCCCIYRFVITWVFVDKLDYISVNMFMFICPDSVHCNASQYHSVIWSSISVSILLTQFALLLSSTVSHTRLQSFLLRWPASLLSSQIFFRLLYFFAFISYIALIYSNVSALTYLFQLLYKIITARNV